MNIAFDVVTGLVFIYLLYSLYATIMMEIISSVLNLRAKNLCYAISRMLMDENRYEARSALERFWERFSTTFIRVLGLPGNMKNPQLYDRFFAQPSIKYLSSGGLGNRPSYLSAENFSKGLLDAIKVDDPDLSTLARVEEGLRLVPENLNFQQFEGHLQLVTGYLAETEVHTRLLVVNPFSEHTGETVSTISLLLSKVEEGFAGLLEMPTVSSSIKAELGKHVQRCDELKGILNALPSSSGEHAGKLVQSVAEGVASMLMRVRLLPESLEVSDTRLHLKSLLEDANQDLEKFKVLLEQWYDDTMERASGWFKQTTQVILLVIGIVLTCTFDVDTIAIVKVLSTNDAARERTLKMAVDISENAAVRQYIESRSDTATSKEAVLAREKALREAQAVIKQDIAATQNLLFPQDTTTAKKDEKAGKAGEKGKAKEVQKAGGHSKVLGYLLTILAISLGAPFWFDLLNKLVKLRSSLGVGQDANSKPDKKQNNESRRTTLARVG